MSDDTDVTTRPNDVESQPANGVGGEEGASGP